VNATCPAITPNHFSSDQTEVHQRDVQQQAEEKLKQLKARAKSNFTKCIYIYIYIGATHIDVDSK